MAIITGIGGLFFRVQDADQLAQWYSDHLGIPKPPRSYEEGSWWQEQGPTIFEPFDSGNDFLAKYDKPLILNFRVDNLDEMVQRLRDAGVSVDVDPQVYPNGRFAFLEDPEQNPIQLWEVAGTDSQRPTGQ